MSSPTGSWKTLDAATRQLVEGTLTPRQLEVVKLLNAGYGDRMISRSLGIDRSTVRGHLAAAERKILKALNERSRS